MSSVQSLGEVYLDVVTVVFADRLADGSSHGQFVGAVSQCHERSGERVRVDGPSDLDQTTGTEDPCRVG